MTIDNTAENTWFNQEGIMLRETTFIYVVCFLLGDSPASEFYTPTFRNTLSIPSSQAGRCVQNELAGDMFGVLNGKGLAWKWPEPLGRRGTECVCVWGGSGWQKSNYCVLGGCLLSLSLCKSGFHDYVVWVHFKFNGFPDETIHVTNFSREEFCVLQFNYVIMVNAVFRYC